MVRASKWFGNRADALAYTRTVKDTEKKSGWGWKIVVKNGRHRAVPLTRNDPEQHLSVGAAQDFRRRYDYTQAGTPISGALPAWLASTTNPTQGVPGAGGEGLTLGSGSGGVSSSPPANPTTTIPYTAPAVGAQSNTPAGSSLETGLDEGGSLTYGGGGGSGESSGALEALDIGSDGFGWEEGGALALIGAGIGLGAWDQTREKDKRVIRIFNASAKDTEELADKVWYEFSASFVGSLTEQELNDQRELLRRDFLRSGPLFKAYRKDDLVLTHDRKRWLPFGREYITSNFKPSTGIATLEVRAEKFVYDTDSGEVFTEAEFRANVNPDTGIWSGQTIGGGGIQVRDARGNLLTLRPAQRGRLIPGFGVTPEEALAGVTKADKKAAKELEAATTVKTSSSQSLAKAEREQVEAERELAEIRRQLARTASMNPADIIAEEDKKRQNQEKRDKEARDRRAVLEETARKAASKKKREDREAVERGYANLSSKVGDNAVSKARFKLDRTWVARFVSSGMGGNIPSSKIESWDYVKDGGPEGDELQVVWTDDHARSMNYPEEYLPVTERWSRKKLIDAGSIPERFGPGGSPIFCRDCGRPEWTTVAPLARKIPAAMRALGVRVAAPVGTTLGERRIVEERFTPVRYADMGSQGGPASRMGKPHAQIFATRIRDAGWNARVIEVAPTKSPSKQTSVRKWAVYMGHRKRGGR
jgi:hypothetical protein